MSRADRIALAAALLPPVLAAWPAGAASRPRGVALSGELKAWHKITLTFDGPATSESATPNPFTDYRLNVTFTKGGAEFVVPGYYCADGRAADTGASGGSKWRCHFAPDAPGRWRYSVSFRRGANVAVSDDPSAGTGAGHVDGASGSFGVRPTDKKGRDHRGKGRLRYVGRHHLRFAGTGEWFLKQGADAPENFLACADFDGDFKSDGIKDELVKTWAPHVRDWRPGDPTWAGGKGKGIVGALNYLASEGMNAFSFLPMNIGGDDRNVFPYTTYSERRRFDCSKLDQWEVVFEHADRVGLHLHFKTQETENDQLLDGGALGEERRLYYRELIARFSHHLAIDWNLGEENTNTDAERKAFARYFHDHDPYGHNIVLHTYPGQQEKVYRPLLGDASKLTGVSIQIKWNMTHYETKRWVEESAASGRPWVVANDEQGGANDGIVPDAKDPSHDGPRAETLWGNLMAGGAGNEYYFGYAHAHSDLTCQDFRSRDLWWDQCRHALEFFAKNRVPFWDMKCDDAKISSPDGYCLQKPGEVYVVYLKKGGTADLDLAGAVGAFDIRWFDPRSGGALRTGDVARVAGGGRRSLGRAPGDASKDWAILVRRAAR